MQHTSQLPDKSPQQCIQQQVSPDVVRKLFRKLVGSDYRTVYKGPMWKIIDRKNKQETEKDRDRECFCKNSTYRDMLSLATSRAPFVCRL